MLKLLSCGTCHESWHAKNPSSQLWNTGNNNNDNNNIIIPGQYSQWAPSSTRKPFTIPQKLDSRVHLGTVVRTSCILIAVIFTKNTTRLQHWYDSGISRATIRQLTTRPLRPLIVITTIPLAYYWLCQQQTVNNVDPRSVQLTNNSEYHKLTDRWSCDREGTWVQARHIQRRTHFAVHWTRLCECAS